MSKDVIELPPIYIGVDPYPIRPSGGRPPSPHDYPGFGIPGHPSGKQSSIYKSMSAKKRDYCSGDWLKTFQDILEKEKGLVVQSKNELRLVAGTDFLCSLGWSAESAYEKCWIQQ